jgi:MurNAc alpha-1-phosphate uridylyltransferase
MKALIFAAGLGERMRPLTNSTPKPLLPVGDKPLIVWHLEKLAAIGIRDVVVNTSWLADRFSEALGDGRTWGMRLHYCYEGPTPLETGGGVWNALTLLEYNDMSTPFIAVNGDIWTDYDFARLPRDIDDDAHLASDGPSRLTFAGIGVYRARLFDQWLDVIGENPDSTASPPRFKLAPLLRAAMLRGRVRGEHHRGRWTDVGTPERLAELDRQIRSANEPSP